MAIIFRIENLSISFSPIIDCPVSELFIPRVVEFPVQFHYKKKFFLSINILALYPHKNHYKNSFWLIWVYKRRRNMYKFKLLLSNSKKQILGNKNL